MSLNEKDWRPITFQGVTFPATLMGIDILLHFFVEENDEDLMEWLMRLSICRGCTKDAPAERCVRCAQQLLDFMLANRQRVLDEIQDCLVPHGFEVEGAYRDWIHAVQLIVKISSSTKGNCFWSAPEHPDDFLNRD
jgi:hypothetical protein